MNPIDYKTVQVSILDRDYGMACLPGEEEALRASARMLDERLREIRMSGKVMGMEKMLVMAAINIAHEHYKTREQLGRHNNGVEKHLVRLNGRLDEAIAGIQQESD